MQNILVFASNNAHKLAEMQEIIGTQFTIKSLADIGCYDDIAETGLTLQENAAIKSRYIFQKFHADCFADDSGLEVDALNGEPGVYSAHYSGSRDAEQNMVLVLDKLKGNTNRKAKFRTVISLLLNGQEHLFEGAVNGTIRENRSGSAGFGYDPVFQPDGYTITFAEMLPGEKSRISHRAIAVKKLVEFLKVYSGQIG